MNPHHADRIIAIIEQQASKTINLSMRAKIHELVDEFKADQSRLDLGGRSEPRCEWCRAFHKEFVGDSMTASCLHPEGLRKVYASGDASCSHYKERGPND